MADKTKKARFLPDYEIVVITQDIPVRKANYIVAEKKEGQKVNPGHFEFNDQIVKGGWLICFPRRHSILLTDETEMVRLGFAEYGDDNEDAKTKKNFQLKRAPVTDHTTGIRLDGDESVMSLAGQIAASTSLKKMGKIPINIGSPE